MLRQLYVIAPICTPPNLEFGFLGAAQIDWGEIVAPAVASTVVPIKDLLVWDIFLFIWQMS